MLAFAVAGKFGEIPASGNLSWVNLLSLRWV